MDDREKDFPKEIPLDREGSVPDEEGREAAAPQEGLSGELEEAKKRLAYLAAEFDNYRKRAAREKDALVAFGNERLLRAVLPFLDNLERAMFQATGKGAADVLLAGVRLTYDQFLSELRKFGLKQVCAEGEMFDPNLHEAIAQVEREGMPAGTVLSEARKGYLLNGRLLRPAQVVVAQGSTAQASGREDGPGPGFSEEGS